MRSWSVLILFAATVLAAFFLLPPPRAAQATPGGALLELGQATAMVGPAYVDSFSVNCGATATPIVASAGSMLAYTCQNATTTKVAVGDSGIGDPTSAQNSPVHCQTNCPSQEWDGNARREYCLADTGTVTIYCRALVATSSPP